MIPETPPIHSARISYPPGLPVSERRDDIAAAIRDHQVVIVAGETGSGKTTQLPKICLELGRTSIGHTQPRRLAARTIAERIANELGTQLGELVGYQVRFTDVVSNATRIKLMTDGILLNELHRDRMLTRYDTIIIDEAHERSLNVDFLLGYLARLLPKRPDLKVIVTSATIDPESFAAHFADTGGTPAPIIEVSGRTFPVEVRYRPLVLDVDPDGDEGASRRPSTSSTSTSGATRETEERDLGDGILDALSELAREEPGDVLVFLAGEADIRDAADTITARDLPGTEVLPLYGRLSAADQHRVFETKRAQGIRRRVVLATNVAETSLTVPGIKYVIDAGTARISRYSARSKIQRLPIEAISQASANQRSGRAGRTSDGIAIRLYSESDLASRPEFTDPEILRTNLAAVILQMLTLGLGDIREFPFLQAPDARGIKDGLDLLRELQAIDADGRVTKLGRRLSRMPVDPRFGRMILESGRHGVTREVMAIVAGLTIQDPRERPLEKRPQADQAHARFTDPTSDFMTLLNLWNYLREKERELSSSAFRRLCRAEFLNYLRVREWGDVFRQLTRLASSVGLTVRPQRKDAAGEAGASADLIHRSILAGLLSQLGVRDERATGRDAAAKRATAKRGDYLGSRNARFTIFPGSALAKKPPGEVMSAELVETSRLFARTNAKVDLQWAEPIAGDLVKKQLSEPHWEKRQGSAVAYERVILFGVPIVERRRVQLARTDPELARELFIRHALVEGEWQFERLDKRLTAFDRANRQLRRELEKVEERTRRRDILFDDEAVFEFYAGRVPASVTDVRAFEKWWRDERTTNPDLLTLTRDDLVTAEEHEPAALKGGFPEHWHQRDQRLRLSYRFEPGAPDDGVTVTVPLALLPRLEPAGFDWQVSGMREQLVTALIKSLPKAIRRNVVPAADWARSLLEDAPEEVPLDISLREYLATQIQRKTYTPVDADDFELERVPGHLLVTFAVVDERGRRLAASKDLAGLQHKFKSRARDTVARVHERTPHALERSGLTAWDFDALPRTLDTRVEGNTVRGYPALIADGTGSGAGGTVDVRVLDTADDQSREHRKGLLRLLLLTVPSPLDYVNGHLTTAERLLLARSPYRAVNDLMADCALAVADDSLGDAAVWSRGEFESVRERFSASVVEALFATVTLVTRILESARTAEKAVSDASNIAFIAPLADAREQIEALVHPGFASRAGLAQLRRYPVYLEGITHRVARLAENPGRDRQWMSEVEAATAKYRAAGGELPLQQDAPGRIRRARWLLEEFRLSLFAQHLGTAEPVSLQRITKALSA